MWTLANPGKHLNRHFNDSVYEFEYLSLCYVLRGSLKYRLSVSIHCKWIRREFRLCWRVRNVRTLACHCRLLHNRFYTITLNKWREYVRIQWMGVCVNKNNFAFYLVFSFNAAAFWNILSEVRPSKDMAELGPHPNTAGNETTNIIYITFPYKVLYKRPNTRYHSHWMRGILTNNLQQWFMCTSYVIIYLLLLYFRCQG